MAKKGNRKLIKLINKATGSFYVSWKNSMNTKDKMTVKKFDPKTKKHEEFTETKF
ncbi:50S ribosomal protein L33 [bacterium]|nr:MAG: 50S ribosomal protein L33 [bacterium]